MFPSLIIGGLRDPSSVTRKLHRIQKRAGIPQIRFHDLRHSFATLSIEQGMDIKTISHMLGHTRFYDEHLYACYRQYATIRCNCNG
jgi:integrase